MGRVSQPPRPAHQTPRQGRDPRLAHLYHLPRRIDGTKVIVEMPNNAPPSPATRAATTTARTDSADPRRRRDPQTRSPRVRVAVWLRLAQRSLPRRPPVLATPTNSGSACGAADAGPCGSSAYLFAFWPPIVDGGPLRARPRPPLRSGPKARPLVELSARKLPLTSRAVSAEIRWTAPLTAGARLRLPE